jgi:hypothetical protein
MLPEENRLKFDVTRFIDAMDVSKTSSNREVGGDLRKFSVDIPNIFGLSVQSAVVDASVIDTCTSAF